MYRKNKNPVEIGFLDDPYQAGLKVDVSELFPIIPFYLPLHAVK